MEAKLMRVALYGRVSTNNGRQDTENQFAQLRQFAGTQRWTIVHEYRDHAAVRAASARSSRRCSRPPAVASSTCCCSGVWIA